jgi:hypothetical protein
MRYNQGHTVEISLESSLISHRVSTVIAVICIVVYAGALLFAGARIYRNTVEQRAAAEQELEDFAVYIVSESNKKDFKSESFREAVTGALGLSRTLRAAIISGISQSGDSVEYVFERAPDAGITWASGKPELKSLFSFSNFPKNTLFKPLAVENQRNVTLQASYNYVDYGVLNVILKQTLAIVLIGFCISCITLLLRFLFVKDTVPIDMDDSHPENKKNEKTDGVSDEDISEEDVFDIFDAKDAGDNKATETDPDESFTADISPDEFAGLFPEEDETFDADVDQEINLLDKLDVELRRSEAFKQDLALITAKVTGEEADGAFPVLTSDAMDFFVLRELVFERGKNGLSIIAPDMDADEGFNKAVEFRAGFLNKHPEFTDKIEIFMGVSSRCEREVDASRVLTEAETALTKAEKGSPVVAFRVDPEKYKEFLRKSETM